jgi:hypothetical protein
LFHRPKRIAVGVEASRARGVPQERSECLSSGLALRASLLSYLVLQFDIVRAFNRNKWVTQFTFLPGF